MVNYNVKSFISCIQLIIKLRIWYKTKICVIWLTHTQRGISLFLHCELCHVCFFCNKALCLLIWLCPLSDVGEVSLVCSVVFVFLSTIVVPLTLVCSLHVENLLLVNFLLLCIWSWTHPDRISHSAHVGGEGTAKERALFKMHVCSQRDLHALFITNPFFSFVPL